MVNISAVRVAKLLSLRMAVVARASAVGAPSGLSASATATVRMVSMAEIVAARAAQKTVMASLIRYKLSGTALNTLPMAIQMISVMSAAVVAGYAFPRLGRKGGFWLGCGIMMIGSLTCAAGIYLRNFPLYCLGAVPAGIGFGISLHRGFGAAEVADHAAMAMGICLLLAGGVLSAIVGP